MHDPLVRNWLKAMFVSLPNRVFLNPLNRYLCRYSHLSDEHKPVFILGAPRCGSTLLSQLLLNTFRLGGLTNLHCLFFGAPVIAEYLFHPFSWQKKIDYQSDYGQTSGMFSPAECGQFWYGFFERTPPFAGNWDVDPDRMREFRNTICTITAIQKRPLLLKNLYNVLRLAPIADSLPEALFIILKRDLLDNAQSILEARKKFAGGYSKWWSVPLPRTEELIHRPPEEQVVEQIRDIYALMDEQIVHANIDRSRFLEINYENLCDDVHGTLKTVEIFLNMHQVNVEENHEVPASINRDKKISIDDALYSRLQSYISMSQ